MRRLLLPAIAFAASAVTAAAQDVSQTGPDGGVFEGDYLIVGAAPVSVPSYEGSNDRTVVPAIGVLGRIGGVGISPRAAGLALDFVPDGQDARVGFSVGPVFRYRSNRARNIKDPVVRRLGELDSVIEGGVAVGVTLYGVLNSFDRFSAGSDFRWDISGKGGGMSIAPGITYFTPLSRAFVMGARVGAEFVDDRYANYNYAVSQAGSAASGLPQYRAHGGLKEVNAAAFVGYDLSGDFLDGGLAVGAGAMYSRLQGSAAETPITAIRGTRNQWFFGGGLAYTF